MLEMVDGKMELRKEEEEGREERKVVVRIPKWKLEQWHP